MIAFLPGDTPFPLFGCVVHNLLLERLMGRRFGKHIHTVDTGDDEEEADKTDEVDRVVKHDGPGDCDADEAECGPRCVPDADREV